MFIIFLTKWYGQLLNTFYAEFCWNVEKERQCTDVWFKYISDYNKKFKVSNKVKENYFYCFTVHFCSLSFSPTHALIYIIKILSQAITLIAHFTSTCFDPYGSSSGSTAGPC